MKNKKTTKILAFISMLIGIFFCSKILIKILSLEKNNIFSILGYTVPFILYISFVLAGIGILKYKIWARNLILISSILNIFNILRTFDFLWIGSSAVPNIQKIVYSSLYLMTLFLSVFFIYYFNRPDIKEQFKSRK